MANEAIPVMMGDQPKQGIEPGTDETIETNEKNINSRLLKIIQDSVDDSKIARQPIDQNFLKYYKFYRGNQWLNKRPSYRASIVMNLIFTTIQTILPILTDNRPNVSVLPQEPSDYMFSQIVQEIVDWNWEDKNLDIRLPWALLESLIYGNGFMKVGYDPNAKDGVGDIRITVPDPFYVYVNKEATDFDDAKVVHYIVPTELPEIKRLYPEKGKEVKGEDGMLDVAFDRKSIGETTFKSPVDQRINVQSDVAPKRFSRKTALLIESWYSAEGAAEYGLDKIVDENGKEVKGSRFIVTAGQTVLRNIKNPFDDQLIPFVRFPDYDLPREFWAMGEVEQLESMQKLANKVISLIVDYMNISSNPIWIVDTSSGVETDNLTNQAGLIIEKNPGTEVRRESPPPLPAYMMNVLQEVKTTFDTISGVHDVTQGRQPTGITSGISIESLQDAAQTRIRLKDRNMGAALRRAGTLMVSRILQFYNVQRTFRLTNKTGWPQYVEFYTKIVPVKDGEGQETEDTKRVAGYKRTTVNPETNEVKTLTVDPETTQPITKEMDVKGMLDVKVGAGSMLPWQKAQRKNEAFKLFEAEAIDKQTLLEAVWPEQAEEIVAKMQANSTQPEETTIPADQPPVEDAGGGV
ncbi:MAG TPA: hypothetical protein P5110_07635 [Candidatus Omnitrophota bacterium]|nr:hypothetical protein [Candidatus Omnitrophota bacterium]